jgi:hypothetical protein
MLIVKRDKVLSKVMDYIMGKNGGITISIRLLSGISSRFGAGVGKLRQTKL